MLLWLVAPQYYFLLDVIQVTLDGSNSDLSKWNCGPIFLLYKTKQIYSLSLEVLYLSNQDLSPVTNISLFFTLHLSMSGRLYTPV